MRVSKRDVVVLVLIWIAVFAVAFLLAVLLADDNPNTDDGAAFGVLAAVAGGLLSGLYLVIREGPAMRKAQARVRAQQAAFPQPRPVSRGLRKQIAVASVLVGLWIAGTLVARLTLGLDGDVASGVGVLLSLGYLLVHLRRSRSD
jgi:hypothetical protein